MAADLFTRASASRAGGDLEGAAHLYEKAIRVDPGMAEAYMNVAYVLSELGRPAEAESAYRFGLRSRRWPAETSAAAHHNLGVLLQDSGREMEATASFRAALAAQPTFAPSLEMLKPQSADREGRSPSYGSLIRDGNDAFAEGHYAHAGELYRRAIPLIDPRVDGSAYVGLGAALHSNRRLSEAKHVLAKGAKLNPRSPGMLQNLATVRSDLGEWKGAAAAWRRALALTPSDAAHYSAAGSTLLRGSRATDALPFLRHAAELDGTNWHLHYGYVHAGLRAAYAFTPPDSQLAREVLRGLRPLHRSPISLDARSRSGAEPPWTRFGGRGLIGDEPPPVTEQHIRHAQSSRRREAEARGRQRGVILYKLGPKPSELDNLRLSLTLLTRYHNRVFQYPVMVAHDAEQPVATPVQEELAFLAGGARLLFERLPHHQLPAWLSAASVPEKVLGFPVAYRHMIRWKASLMWQMAALEPYDFVWSLDTDSFLLGPLTYDVFALMAARNATYGYMDVHSEDPSIVGGLADCMQRYLRSRPLKKAGTTMLSNFRDRHGRWDGSKFYTNFQVARREFGNSEGYRDLFDFIDRDGGIYRHRWGADPILFLAVTLLLREDQVIHFDDVPYMHQHLVANLPQEPIDELEQAPTLEDDGRDAKVVDGNDNTAACDQGHPQAASVPPGSPAPVEPARPSLAPTARAILYLSSPSHAASAVNALLRFHELLEGSGKQGKTSRRRHCGTLPLKPCVSDALAASPEKMDTVRAWLDRLPTTIRARPVETCSLHSRAPLGGGWQSAEGGLPAVAAALQSIPQSGELAAAAEATATVLQMAIAINQLKAAGPAIVDEPREKPNSTRLPPLLLICIDETDALTMAAALGARVANGTTVNVCDTPDVDDGTTPLPSLRVSSHSRDLASGATGRETAGGGLDSSAEAMRLLEAAAGC